MPDPGPWPNVEQVALDAIADLFPFDRVGTATPGDLENRCPFARVRRIGGADVDPFTDAPRIAVDVFALTYAEGVDFAERVRQRLRSEPEPFDTVLTITGPTEQEWASGSRVRRWSATYRTSLRRTAA
jgi:hypothetical protein